MKRTLLVFLCMCLLGTLALSAQDDGESFLPDDLQPITINNVLDVERLQTLRYGTPRAVQWSADGEHIAVLTPAAVYIFAATDLDAPLVTLESESPLQGMALKADGSMVAMYDTANVVSIWNIINDDAESVAREQSLSHIRLVSYTDDERLLAVTQDDTGLYVADLTNEQLMQINDIPLTNNIDVAISDDASQIAIFHNDTLTISATDDATPVQTITVENLNRIYRLAFSPDGERIAISGIDTAVRVWNIESGELVDTYTTEIIDVPALAWSNDSDLLAAGVANPFGPEGNDVYLWRDGIEQRFIGHTGPIIDVSFDPQGAILASISIDGTLRLWHIESGDQIAQSDGFRNMVDDVSIGEDGTLLAVAAGELELWNLETGLLSLNMQDVIQTREVVFLPDSDLLSAGSSMMESNVRRWQVSDNELEGAVIVDHFETVTALARSADGSTLLSSSIDATRLTNLDDGTQVDLMTGVRMMAAAVNADGSQVALATLPGDVIVLAADGTEIARRTFADAGILLDLMFDPGGETLLLGTDEGGMFLLEAATLETIWMYPYHAVDSVYSGSGDEVVIFSVGRDGLLAISPENGVYILVVDYQTTLESLAISADGTRLVGGGSDGRVYIWGVPGSNAE